MSVLVACPLPCIYTLDATKGAILKQPGQKAGYEIEALASRYVKRKGVSSLSLPNSYSHRSLPPSLPPSIF
jgi:hypothetical protein